MLDSSLVDQFLGSCGTVDHIVRELSVISSRDVWVLRSEVFTSFVVASVCERDTPPTPSVLTVVHTC